MPTIVGIHGIGQQYTCGPQLTSAWFDALRGGLEASGHRSKADALEAGELRVGFFGDLFRPAGAMAAGDPQFTAADVAPGPERDLLVLLYEEAVAQEPALGPPSGAMGPGMVAVQVMLHKLARSKTLAGVVERLFIRDLKQVNRFLDDPGVKGRVLERVHAEVDPRTRILVGHSLGSVVAYEYLCRYQPPQVRLLVTLGSPLGIPNLVFDRLTPPPSDRVGAWPGTVGAWVNVADPDDIVALDKSLADLFPGPSGSRVADRLVDNGDEPHAIDRYLTTREVGEALATVL